MSNEKQYHNEQKQKLGKSNNYGFAVTKPMPTGCIKEFSSPSWLKFNLLLETVDLGDGFDDKKRQKENNCIMSIFPPVIQNQKSIKTN